MSSPQAGNTVLNGFRLSLSSSDPAPASDVLAATSGYLVPFTNDAITLVKSDGTLILDNTNGGNVSISFGSFTAGNVYRIFASDSGATGSIALSATQWQNSSTPGSSLALSPATPGGFLVLSSDHTQRYIGDVYCTANGQVNDAVQDRGVFNNENRIGRRCAAIDTTSSWSVSAGATHSRDNNTTYGVGRFGLLIGNADIGSMVLTMDGAGHPASSGFYQFGFQVDSTTGFARSRYAEWGSTTNIGFSASWIYQPALGRHFFQAMEAASSGSAWTMQGAQPETVLEAYARI